MHSNAVKKLTETIEKLSRLTTTRGATPDEAAAAQRKITIIQAKLATLTTTPSDIPRAQPTAHRFIWKTKGNTIRTKPTLDPAPEATQRVYVERHKCDCLCGKHPGEYISKHYVWETRDGGRTWKHIYKEKPPTPPPPIAANTPAPEQTIFPNYNDLQNRYRIHE
jgi:hypothetical protein